MKKNLIRLLAAALGVACVMSLSACGGNGGDKKTSSTAPVSSTAAGTEASTAGTESTPASQAGDVSSEKPLSELETVEDFVNSSLIKGQLDSMKEEMSGQGLDIDITAEGNKLVYTFAYQDLQGADRDTVAAALEGAMDSMAATFEDIAAQLKDAVEQDDVSVEVRYLDDQGEELCTREFFPSEGE